MKVLVMLIISMLVLVSCVQYPEDENFIAVIDKEMEKYPKSKYEIHVYDCSNMSYDMAINLCNMGYDSKVYAYEYGFQGHAVVQTLYKGKYYYSDPARRWSFIRTPKGKVYGIYSPYEIPDKWVKEFKGHLK